MTLHVINLDTYQPMDQYANPDLQKAIMRNREERILSIVRQAKRDGISLRIWEGDTSDRVFPAKNISRSFKKIVAYAKQERLPFVRIAEDDMVLTTPTAWKYYIDNTPVDYDMYSGGLYHGELNGNRIFNGYSGHTLITVHERFYDDFLAAKNDESVGPECHLDVWLGQNLSKEKKFIVCLPFVVKQLGGYSENKKANINYSMYEEKWQYHV